MTANEPLIAETPLPANPGDVLRLRGVRTHNLKNLDVDIPRDQLTVITGPSGSGKSSLAFDTIFAEGQRQYLESLSVTARQFVHQLERPDLDWIDGLQPTLAIDQRGGSPNPRSTVGTITEIYDYLRILFARLGTPYCPRCQEPILPQPVEDILADLLSRPTGTKLMLLAPKQKGEKGKQTALFEEIRKAGFLRARVDGEVHDVDPPPELNPRKAHTVEAVIDRIIVRENIADRLGESLRLAIHHGGGAVLVCELAPGQELTKQDGKDITIWEETLYSTLSACPICKQSYPELEPRSFSFNSPYGACPECQGLGNRVEFDPRLVFPDEALALSKGACTAWRGLGTTRLSRYQNAVREILPRWNVRWETPLADWPETARETLWRGEGKEFSGLATLLEQEFVTTLKPKRREQLENFRGEVACAACGGSRLRPEARAVRFAASGIHELVNLSLSDAAAFFLRLAGDPDEIAAADQPIYEPLAREIRNRLAFLQRVGVGYLTLSRGADTLSGGESQRVRLATSIGSGLVGVCYILDEPSIGLHPRDNDRLIESLRDLQQQGTTVIVVEHDEATMRAADRLIDMGPGAGIHGGQIIAQGTPQEVAADPASLTGAYLNGRAAIAIPANRRRVKHTQQLIIEGCTANNLKNVTVSFPLGVFLCVTGVSGSGKSTLVNGTLARAVRRRLMGEGPHPGDFASLRGVNLIDRLIRIDQSSIGRTPRSNPATYTGIFDEIRKLFAATKEAKLRGYKASRFSFNVKEGRCEECQGQGVRRIAMNFLPDLEVPCDSCGRTRYNAATLEIRFRGRNIAEALDLPIAAAVEFFANIPLIAPLVKCLERVGLGYLTLGQAGNTLSGGEAQRIKLATELGKANTGRTLYLLDEPTTGLHFDDIAKLLGVLHELVEQGNTVLAIEHNLDVIKMADYVIDLGPDGGQAGGEIVISGTPEEVAACEVSLTGRHLREVLNKTGSRVFGDK